MTDDLEQKKADIRRARAWAKAHWNAYIDEEHTPSTLLDPQRFAVEFPDVDRLSVWPMMYEERLAIGQADYRLAWLGRGVAWVGGLAIRPDITATLYIDEEARAAAGKEIQSKRYLALLDFVRKAGMR